MDYIEVTAKTVEDALTNALIQLETTSDMVEYEVIEKGGKGFLGIGSKNAVIRVRKKEESATQEVKTPATESVANHDETDTVKEEKPVQATMSHEEVERRITTFLNEMFHAMDMQVAIEITFDKKNDCVNVDLSGDNMGVLIGKRGQTLDSIQYLTSLVVNKGKEKYVRIKVDTEDYRNRRKETLESLAKNIAYKVKRSRRSVSLEPMNPYERRIIHAALQNDKYVSTKSEGEEPFRHVVIYLDKEKSANKYEK